jgi:hypothetical protein
MPRSSMTRRPTLEEAEQGDQAPHRRGGHLPQQDGDQAAHWGRPPQAEHDEWATSRRYLSVGGPAGEEVTTGFLERKEAVLLPWHLAERIVRVARFAPTGRDLNSR